MLMLCYNELALDLLVQEKQMFIKSEIEASNLKFERLKEYYD